MNRYRHISKLLLSILCVVVLCLMLCGSVKASSIDYNLILRNIRQENVYSPSEGKIQSYLESMGDDGSFSDINYEDKSNRWEPQVHYGRLLQMAYAYISPSNKYYKKTELYFKIVKGINYWLSINPTSNNWYHTQMSEPLEFGMILIAMRAGEKNLPVLLEQRVIERWAGNGSDLAKMTGANLAEMSIHWLYFGCLTKDDNIMEQAINSLYRPVAYTDAEGLQVDNSFLQHGHQLYIGGYGEVMIGRVLQAALYLKGTRFALPKDKLAILRNYIVNSYSNVLRGRTIHWNAIGRQLSRPGYLYNTDNRILILERMKSIDSKYASVYDSILNRIRGVEEHSDAIQPSHTHYFRGDYTVHVRPDFSFATRMVSSRTCRQESINGENLLGYFLSDGSMVITCTGEEYNDIMPLWDWNKIPGVTAPTLKEIPHIPSIKTFGTSSFAGGVSDSIYGCTGYSYYDTYAGVNTGASKGCFFFDSEVVCLGAGINSTHNEVWTTVNQCWGKDSFVVGTSEGIKVYEGDVSITDINDCRWVLHDGIGYYFPENQAISVENKEKKGNWNRISTMWGNREVKGKVFTLGIKCRVPVRDRTCSYIIIPNSTVESIQEYADNSETEILTNTKDFQIVHDKRKGIYECICYNPDTIIGELEIDTRQPCVFLLKEENSNYYLFLSDPLQNQKRIRLGVRTKDMENMSYCEFDFSGDSKSYTGRTFEKEIRIVSSSTNRESSTTGGTIIDDILSIIRRIFG